MKEYPITIDIFTASDAYRSSKVCKRTGIQVHSVGCKGTTMARWKKSWNRAGRDVCGGYIIDMDGIYQVLPEGKRCWLSGKGKRGNANDTHLGFEICEPLTRLDTPDVAADLYGKVLYLCVTLCRKYGINPANIQAHYELHAQGLASNHADVRHWWGRTGTAWEPYTMDRLRRDVASEIGVAQAYTQAIQKGSKGDAVKELQAALNMAGAVLVVDGSFGPLTEEALMKYQASKKIEADGICGPVTWGKIKQGG